MARFFRSLLQTRPLAFSAVTLALAVGGASAIQPERWVHSTEADFEPGEFEGVVLTNLGDLKLATASTTLAELPEDVTIINDLETIGQTTYLAVGPEPRLLRLDGDAVEEVATPDAGQVFSLAQIDGRLIVGTSGEAAGVWLLRDTELVPIVSWEDRQYLWDLAPVGDDLYVATGAEGEVLRLPGLRSRLDSLGQEDAEPVAEEIALDSAQANVLCLAVGPDQVVYAGTDTDGLIYRLEGGESFVVYDAGEPEIGALLVAADGTLYAGTADAEQAKPGRLATATESETGRPSLEAAAAEASDTPPADGPDAPDLPVTPEPDPLQAADLPEPSPGPADEAPAAQSVESDTADTAPAESGPQADSESDEASGKPELAEDNPPTPEQLDALREEVRQRLMAARKDGSLKPSGGPSAARPTRQAAAASAGDKSGNAVYRIDAQGFVSEVFRDSVMILNLAQRPDGKILVGTGNEGQLYLIDPAAGETSVLNDLESQQLLAMRVRDDGVLAAGSNPASLQLLQGETAPRGTYTSQVLDAAQISLWGTVQTTTDAGGRDGQSPAVTVETRSGNVADPELGSWSEWTDAQALDDQGFFPQQRRLQQVKVASPPARYLQYRLTLEAGESPDAAPVLEKIELAYVTPNLRPSLTSLTAEYPEFAGVDQPANPAMSISWEATDDNGDRLLYRLEYKSPDADRWITLAEDLTDTSFEWNTRQVPDGRYQVRVTASDRLDNPGDMAMTAGRRTDPVLLDNTPPLIDVLRDGQLQPLATVEVQADAVRIAGTAVDRQTPIHSVAYRLNNEEQYHPILAEDLIYDSTVEPWSATLSDLASGAHSITIRTLDLRGNASYASMIFEVP